MRKKEKVRKVGIMRDQGKGWGKNQVPQVPLENEMPNNRKDGPPPACKLSILLRGGEKAGVGQGRAQKGVCSGLEREPLLLPLIRLLNALEDIIERAPTRLPPAVAVLTTAATRLTLLDWHRPHAVPRRQLHQITSRHTLRHYVL